MGWTELSELYREPEPVREPMPRRWRPRPGQLFTTDHFERYPIEECYCHLHMSIHHYEFDDLRVFCYMGRTRCERCRITQHLVLLGGRVLLLESEPMEFWASRIL